MASVTADSFASITVGSPARGGTSRKADVMRRYINWFGFPKREPQFLDFLPESLIYSPTLVEPAWLATTRERINRSVAPSGHTEDSDGRWLRRDIADAAIDFFKKTADLLPGEPFIYSSQQGDLVAEFKADRGTLTTIVSSTFAVLFAVVDGEPIERVASDAREARQTVEELTGQLRVERHGTVAAPG